MQPVEAIAERDIRDERGLLLDEERVGGVATRRPRPAEKVPPKLPSPSGPRAAWAAARACRPGQWFKNVFVLLAPAAAGAFTRPGAATSVWAAAIAFCLLSSAIALVETVSGRTAPRGQKRPFGATELPREHALRLAATLAAAALICATVVSPALAAVMLCYVLGRLTR